MEVNRDLVDWLGVILLVFVSVGVPQVGIVQVGSSSGGRNPGGLKSGW